MSAEIHKWIKNDDEYAVLYLGYLNIGELPELPKNLKKNNN